MQRHLWGKGGQKLLRKKEQRLPPKKVGRAASILNQGSQVSSSARLPASCSFVWSESPIPRRWGPSDVDRLESS